MWYLERLVVMPVLTKSYVDKLESGDNDVVVWDSKLSGFGLKITPAGRKVYLLKYRTLDGRQRKPAIGVHGQITCEQARDIAFEWLGQRARGEDPSLSRQTQRQSPTVSELCDRFMKEHSILHKKPTTIELEERAIRKYIKPLLGSLKVASVTKADISKFHAALKSTPPQANRILQTLSKMFSLSEEWGLRPEHSNPVKGVQKYREESRERFLNTDEIQRLLAVMDKLEREGEESIHFLNLIRLLMLTGARLTEIRTAKWEWVDFNNGILNLPDSKTGKKPVHLSSAAIDVLNRTPKIDGNPYIIVGNVAGNSLYNAQKAWRRIRKLAWLHDLRIHDLRHTFASLCIAQGFSLQMVAKLLGHADTRMSERYAHLTKTSVQEAAKSVGNLIQTASETAKSA